MARGRPRSDAERTRALAIYEQQGLAAAALQTGVPKPTLVRWAQDAGIQLERVTERSMIQHRQAAAASVATMEQRRGCLARVFMTIAETHAGAVAEGKVPSPRDEQTFMTVAAIAVDKAQLLSGQATQRTETVSPDQAREELTALQQQWRRRHAS